MSLRLDMLQTARSAPDLPPDAADRVVEFLRGQFNDDGGGRGRSRESDLYYTVFALDGLAALGATAPVDRTLAYLRAFGDGAELDFVHLACLARCWASMPPGEIEPAAARRILHHVENCRREDGGYAARIGGGPSRVYHAFLACGAYQDLRDDMPHPSRLVEFVQSRWVPTGGYTDDDAHRPGTVPTTAAAVVLLKHLGAPVEPQAGDWLRSHYHPHGGFKAGPNAPLPDLLSTATALHALAQLGVSLADVRESCLDFLDSLWTGQAFRGHPADDTEDSEYTFYALLALGCLGS